MVDARKAAGALPFVGAAQFVVGRMPAEAVYPGGSIFGEDDGFLRPPRGREGPSTARTSSNEKPIRASLHALPTDIHTSYMSLGGATPFDGSARSYRRSYGPD